MSGLWGILTNALNDHAAVISAKNDALNLEFDVVMAEDHSWSATPTSNPVEKGSPVTDHVQRSPDELSMSGVISDTSMHGYLNQFGGMLSEGESAVQRTFDRLYQLIDMGLPVTVYTRYRQYPDMVLTQVSIPRKPENGNSIEFTANFKHIRQVSTLLVDASEAGINPEKTENESTGRKAKPKRHLGTKQPNPASAATQKSVVNIGSCYKVETPAYRNVSA